MDLEWRSEEDLLEHFELHAADLGLDTVEAYERSSKTTAEVGTSFSYRDRSTGDWHVGYYDRLTGRFMGANQELEIVTHFRCDEAYVRRLWESDYA